METLPRGWAWKRFRRSTVSATFPSGVAAFEGGEVREAGGEPCAVDGGGEGFVDDGLGQQGAGGVVDGDVGFQWRLWCER